MSSKSFYLYILHLLLQIHMYGWEKGRGDNLFSFTVESWYIVYTHTFSPFEIWNSGSCKKYSTYLYLSICTQWKAGTTESLYLVVFLWLSGLFDIIFKDTGE